MAEVASLEVLIGADIRGLDRGLRDADRGLSGFGRRMRDVGGDITGFGMAMAGLGAPFIAFGATGLRVAADFDSAMAEISARTGIFGDDLDMVRELALQMGADTAFSAQEAADAMLELLASGQSVEEMMATLPFVLDAAAASGEDLGQVADDVTNILASFGLEVTDAEMVVNALAQAAAASSADMGSLGEGFANVGGVARMFGLDVEETAAALAILAENGVQGAEAGTALKSTLLHLFGQTADTRGALEELGVTLYDNQGNVRDFDAIIDDLGAALSELPVEEQNRLMTELGGSYGIVGLSALIAAGGTDTMIGAMNDAATAADVARARMDTFTGALDSLMGSVETLQITALTPLMEDTLKPLIQEHLIPLVNEITAWAAENPELTSQIILLGSAVGVFGIALAGAGAALGAIGTALAALFSPIGLAIAAVVALGAAYATNFAGIRDFIDGEVRPIVESFFNFLAEAWEFVRPALEALAQWFTETALPDIMNFIQNDVMPVVQFFIDVLEGLWRVVSVSLGELFNWFMSDGLEAIRGFIEDTVIPIIRQFRNLLAGIWNTVRGPLESIVNFFRNTFAPIADNFIRPVINAVRDIINAVNDALNALAQLGGAQAGGPVGGAGTGGEFYGVPAFAEGGMMMREGLAYLHAGERVLNPQETRDYNSGQGGPSYTINVMMPPGATREDGRAFGAAIAEELRFRG